MLARTIGASMTKLPKLDLDVVDIVRVQVTADAAGETVVTLEAVGGQLIDMHLSPHASSKLEAFMATASVEQAKRAPKH
jgi:hypothetical protein